MRLVIVESPFAGKGDSEEERRAEQALNEAYLSKCLNDCVVNHDESPYASHRMLTGEGVLDDTIPRERQLGIMAGFAFRAKTEASVFYVDRGISRGMMRGIKDALSKMHAIEFRAIAPGSQKLTHRLDELALENLRDHTIQVVWEENQAEFAERLKANTDFAMYAIFLNVR